MFDPVDDAPVGMICAVVLAGVTNTLSLVETPAAVQSATPVVDAVMLGKSTWQVPKRICVTVEPLEPMTAPLLSVASPETPSVLETDEDAVEIKPASVERPETPSVELSVDAPVTDNVPSVEMLVEMVEDAFAIIATQNTPAIAPTTTVNH